MIDVIHEDILAPITAAHEMVDGSGKSDRHLPWHDGGSSQENEKK
jgi:hypothetical protein